MTLSELKLIREILIWAKAQSSIRAPKMYEKQLDAELIINREINLKELDPRK